MLLLERLRPPCALRLAEAVRHGVVARIVTSPHDAHRQDPHLPMRYDTGRPRAVIRLRISQAEDGLTPLPGWTPGAKAIADDGRVAEERVLHPALTMVPGRLLPLAPAELLHQRDRSIPRGRPRLANRRNQVGASGCSPSSLRKCPTLCASSYSRPLAG